MRLRLFYLSLLSGLFVLACGSKNIASNAVPYIFVTVNGQEISTGGKVAVYADTTKVGGELTFTVTIMNPGSGPLEIYHVGHTYKPATPQESAQVPAFRLENVPPDGTLVAPQGEGTPDRPDKIQFNVIYHRYDDGVERKDQIIIDNSSVTDQDKHYVINFVMGYTKPILVVDPPQLDFEGVVAGSTAQKQLLVKNNGGGTLTIDGFKLTGDAVFALQIGNHKYDLSDATEQGIIFDQPIALDQGAYMYWKVFFAPKNDDAVQATLTIFSNDPDKKNGFGVVIMGNAKGPKLKVEPNPIEFGGVKQGTYGEIKVMIRNQGTEDVVIKNISLSGSNEFQLDFKQLSTKKAPTPQEPLILHYDASQGNTVETFVVRYVPVDVSPTDANGKPILDKAVLKFDTYKEVEVNVTGYGVSQTCPIPVIVIQEGEEVEPQTTLHLDGTKSVPSGGTIQSYSWNVDQPSDNKFLLLPSNNSPNPTHEVNIAGTYKYCLDVCDSTGKCSNDPDCKTTACTTVVVKPKGGIHVELTWNTPGDPDQTDEGPDAGSDLDLHFAHPFATGPDIDGDGQPDPWFNIPYDCYWRNRHPQWESVNPNVKDDPSLDRDDTDGAGPENINLDVPKTGRTYKVGVHYWDSHGYGDSDPTVKIYIYGKLMAEFTMSKNCGTVMHEKDMWDVARITWKGYEAGQQAAIIKFVQGPNGAPCKITHHYVNEAVSGLGGD